MKTASFASALVMGLGFTLGGCGPGGSSASTTSDGGDAGDAAQADGAIAADGGDSSTTFAPWIKTLPQAGVVTKVAALDDGVVLATATTEVEPVITFARRARLDGALRWSTPIASVGTTTVFALGANEATGDTTALLHFGGEVTIGNQKLTRTGIEGGYAVIRLAGTDGSLVWTSPLNTSSAAVAAFTEVIAISNAGDVALVGTASLTQTFGTLSANDGFVLTLASADGVPKSSASFVKSPQTFYPPTMTAVAFDGKNQVWATSRFSGTVAFGGTDLTASGAYDGVVLRLSSDLKVASVNPIATSASDTVTAIVADRAGNVFARGVLGVPGGVGGGALPAGEWIGSWDEAGVHRWSKPMSAYGGATAKLSVAAGANVDLAFANGSGVAIAANGTIARTYPALAGTEILDVAGAQTGRYVGGHVPGDATVFGMAIQGPIAVVAYVP